MFTNVVLGAISIAVLVPTAQAASAHVRQDLPTPTALPHSQVSPVVTHRLVVVQPRYYEVRPGDTLSGISAHLYHNASYWPRLYEPNKRIIGNDPNLIYPGQKIAGGWPGGSFGACVVARESGGNSQVMNSSGHYGLYQFSASTWVAYGGNPATFGHASISEQESVFMNAMARGGQSNWSPYDGCTS